MNNETNIEMPDRNERALNIQAIVDAAIPAKRTMTAAVRHLGGTIGIKNAFCGVGDAVFAAVVVSFSLLFFMTFLNSGIYDTELTAMFYIVVMLCAPVIYFSMFTFTYWKERMTGTWEVISSCRYDLKYITAVRLIIISLAGIVFIPIVMLPLSNKDFYLNILTSALFSLLLYSTFSLLMLLISESLTSRLAVPVIWVTGWVLISFMFTVEEVGLFLNSLPVSLNVVFICVLLILYLIEVRVYIKRATCRAFIMNLEENYA